MHSEARAELLAIRAEYDDLTADLRHKVEEAEGLLEEARRAHHAVAQPAWAEYWRKRKEICRKWEERGITLWEA